MNRLISIYVSTYGKYKNDSSVGKWIDLPMGDNRLAMVLKKIAGDEPDPKFMIQETITPPGLDFRDISTDENIESLNKEIYALTKQKGPSHLSANVNAALAEYRKCWDDKNEMFISKKDRVSEVYKTEAGDLVIFEVPWIETSYCLSGSADASDEEEYFVTENMKMLDGIEETLSEAHPCGLREIYPSYPVALLTVQISCQRRFEMYPEDEPLRVEFTQADVVGLKKMLAYEKEKFTQRLRAWWRRYGNKGATVYSYNND